MKVSRHPLIRFHPLTVDLSQWIAGNPDYLLADHWNYNSFQKGNWARLNKVLKKQSAMPLTRNFLVL